MRRPRLRDLFLGRAETAEATVSRPAWDGRLHYDGEPDRFARTRALMEKEDDMHAVSEFVGAYVTTTRVLWFGLSMFGLAWIYYAWQGAKEQLFDIDKNTGRPYQPERIELLHERAARLKQVAQRSNRDSLTRN